MTRDSITRASRLRALASALVAGLVALAVYWRTCHPTITWWDSAQYSLAADSLGIVGAPGSLLLTLMGWFVTRLPLAGSSAFELNLLSGLLSALTIALTVVVACGLYLRVARRNEPSLSWPVTVAFALGALPLAFGPTLWAYSVKFTPYSLTATMTAVILFALLRWWDSADAGNGNRWLFLIALLVGIDFSVHRTNSLLIPGIALWIVIHRPRIVASIRSWVSSLLGLVLGLSMQLLLIPMAARAPVLNMGTPWNLGRLWDYISLEQTGGGFLINFFPRRAGFFEHQLRDVMDALAGTFFAVGGSLAIAGLIPLALAVFGIATLWRRERRLAVAIIALFVISVLTTVAYFNIPESYFRPLHRHYLPCLVIFGAISAYGAGAVIGRVQQWGGRGAPVLTGALLAILAAVAIGRATDNYVTQDRSRSYFAHDFASNLLNQLPRDAILLTNGDNDTFPLWYVQVVEGERRDVNVINVPLTNTSWYVKEVLCGERGVAFSRSLDEMAAISPVTWEEQVVVLPPTGESAGDSVRVTIAPTAGTYLLTQDQVVLDMILANRWVRPVMVATTVSPSTLPWLRPNLRLEGIAYRFVPNDDPSPDIDTFRANLMERSQFHGYADPAVYIDATSAAMAQNYLAAFIALANLAREEEGVEGCEEIIRVMNTKLPAERLHPSDQLLTLTTQACEAR